jgi:hypothetical protein
MVQPESANCGDSPLSKRSLRVYDDPPAVGRNAVTQLAEPFMIAFPDLRVVMDDLLLQANEAKYRRTLFGTDTGPGGTGHTVRVGGFEE